MDLLQVDLFTGEGAVYKLGAAPTYVRRGSSVRRIAGSSLPAGLAPSEHAVPDHTRLRLEAGTASLWSATASPELGTTLGPGAAG